jgi:hypothetical protein
MNRKTSIQNERGMAMMAILFFTLILYPLSAVFIATVVNENILARMERDTAKAFYASHGAGQLAINQLDVLINTYLKNTIANSNPSGVISYASSEVAAGDGITWLTFSVRNANVPVLTQNGEQAEYNANGTINGAAYTYQIVITEKSDPVTVGTNAWDFPFSYRIDSSGVSGASTSKVAVSGDFTVRVQKDNFAKYALFTNAQTLPDGSTSVWFTSKTDFNGPVHTNGRFNFAFNPSGTFDELITQQQQQARFYNGGSAVLLDNDHNGSTDVPVLNGGFNRGVSAITLSTTMQQSDMSSEALGGKTFGSNGIYLPANGAALTGGIYVKGDSSVAMSVDGSGNAVYSITQGVTNKVVTVNKTTSQTSVLSGGVTTTYSGTPDGTDHAGTLLYVEGSITSLQGTVQSHTQLTVGSSNDIIITNNVRYADYTAASGTPGTTGYVPPSADGKDNLLGLVSWQGDVRVGSAAPNNVEIHGTIMAMNGIFQVDNYDTGASRGTATLLGGVISNNYGAFGTFNSSTGVQVSGYGRNFIYDQRMGQGSVPPYFPSLNTFIAFTNDITDKMVWQEGGKNGV